MSDFHFENVPLLNDDNIEITLGKAQFMADYNRWSDAFDEAVDEDKEMTLLVLERLLVRCNTSCSSLDC